MLILLAGPCAEEKVTGRPRKFAANDLRGARTLVNCELRDIKQRGSISLLSHDQRLQKAHGPAVSTVNRHWRSIRAVANHLLICRRLNGQHIAHLQWSETLP